MASRLTDKRRRAKGGAWEEAETSSEEEAET